MFWQAFSAKLGTILGPEEKAISFLKSTIMPTHAISAISQDGALLGVAGFKTQEGAFVGGGFEDVAKHYGTFNALWRTALLAPLERETKPDELLMDGIFVHQHARGNGVGSLLLEAIVDEAKKRNLSSVRLDVIDTNPRAKKLYESKGFKSVARSHTGIFKPLFGFSYATTMVKSVENATRT